MTLTFDWFLPTSGDGRTIYGRGHNLPIAQAQALPIPGDRPPDIEYTGRTLREHYGIPRPENVFTAARPEALKMGSSADRWLDNLQPCQWTSRDSQPCSATWASRAR
jgi:hypothetical protein